MEQSNSSDKQQNGNGNGNQTVRMLHERQRIFESIQRRLDDRRTLAEKFADAVVVRFGTFSFCVAHGVVFVAWILVNLGYTGSAEIFDPYPFNLLTMAVSLEAIFLSVFVLINQNRASKIADLRQEIDLQVNMIAEQEITKIIHLLSYMMKYMNVPMEKDSELKYMMRPLDLNEIREELEHQLRLSPQNRTALLSSLRGMGRGTPPATSV